MINAGDTIWNRHARQATAASEGIISNADDAIWDCVVPAFGRRKLDQIGFVYIEQNSVLRRILGITFAYFNASQTTAAKEGIIPNAGDVLGDRHARQTTAVSEGVLPNAGNAVGYSSAR